MFNDLMQSSKVTAARELIAEETRMQELVFYLNPEYPTYLLANLLKMIKKPVLSDPEKIPATARPGKPG